MNIIHVSTTDLGGAANVAKSLTEHLNERDNITSTVLVGTKTTDRDYIRELPSIPFERVLNYGIERIASLDGLAAPSSFRLRRILQSHDADVVHLHNLHGGFFNLFSLLTVPSDVRIVWTFHDMWPFTGNCVYAHGCDRFQSSCGECPQTDTYPSLLFDTTPLLLKLKAYISERADIHAVCPSRWILEQAERSRVEFTTTEHIPNGVNTDHFQPKNSQVARDRFNIPENDRTLLFLAHNVDVDRKGMSELVSALNRLSDKEQTTLLVIGDGSSELNLNSNFTVRQPGFVPHEDLPLAYSAADLFVIPSFADNFPLTVLESMACSTPVVGFPTGGITEQIVHQKTGWLCEDMSIDSLTETLEEALSDGKSLQRAGDAANTHIQTNYEISVIVDEYLEMYNTLVNDCS